MSRQTIHCQHLWQNGAWQPQQVVTLCNGLVESIQPGQAGDCSVPYLTPGLIDNHTHGGDGFCIMEADEAGLETWLLRLAQAGVSGVMACPYGDQSEIERVLAVVKTVMRRQADGLVPGARLLGAHLEGPFLSPDRPGAMQPHMILPPSIKVLTELLDGYGDIIREMTLAPEVPGAQPLITRLRQAGIRVLAGHTECGYEQAEKAFRSGVGALCHSFNACPPLHHRAPGIVAAALAHSNVICEAICDLQHLHPGILKLMYACKGAQGIMGISDSVSTTHLPDGIYPENGLEIHVENGVSRLADGTLNGGGCYISRSLAHLVSIGIHSQDAVTMFSQTPARWLGLRSHDIAPGLPVCLSAWDERFGHIRTWIDSHSFEQEGSPNARSGD